MIKKPKILFASHDPGGANIIDALIDLFFSDNLYEVYLLALGKAKLKINTRNKSVHKINIDSKKIKRFPNESDVNEKDISKLFDKFNFSYVFSSTSWNSNLEKSVIKYAKKNNIPSFSIIDFWHNYKVRFTLKNKITLPDVIFATDKKMQNELFNIFPESKIIVSGNPHLLRLKKLVKRNSKTETSLNIRLFSENIKHYFPEKKINEFTITENIIKYIYSYDKKCNFIIRPHPMESIKPWQEFINNLNTKYKSDNFKIMVDTADYYDALKNTSIAIGFSSMSLIESSMIGIPTYSYQIGINKSEEYFFLPYEEYNIIKLKKKKDIGNVFKKSKHIISHGYDSNQFIKMKNIFNLSIYVY